MILGFTLLTACSFFQTSLTWFTFSAEVVLLQSLSFYYLYRLAAMRNVYQLAGYSALLLVVFAAYLFFLQLDVFACFLLVAESIVVLFALSILMHLNYTNIKYMKIASPLLIVVAFGLI